MLQQNSNDSQWQHPKQLLKLQKLKVKKQALQERISRNLSTTKCASSSSSKEAAFENIFQCKKRKNPFEKESSSPHLVKKSKYEEEAGFLSESVDQTLFKLINPDSNTFSSNRQQQDTSLSSTTFSEILTKKDLASENTCEIRKSLDAGTQWCPIDWTLKRKIRLMSLKPFPWSQKLKIGEEASGITSFTRCLDMDQCKTSLDMSPNAKLHQCCLYWQQPFLPWLSLFPRNTLKTNSSGINLGASIVIKNSLYEAWTDSLKSLYQLIRTRQCPYFYVCANTFTALFRAAGISGNMDINVMVTPTTRGFRHLLNEEDIEFEMPLKVIRLLESQDLGELDNEEKMEPHVDDDGDEDWLAKLGINANDIKNINYTQARIEHKTECQVDSSDQSLILIKGVEVNSFFNFLINCKSAIAPTGTLAGVPPTLLAPVSFQGATLNALKVRENKIHSEGADYYSLELTGPILPSTVHNIFNINHSDHSITMTFNDVESTRSYSKVGRKDEENRSDIEQKGTAIFGKENLSDCGLNNKVLRHFCSADLGVVSNVECLKYSGDAQRFTWT